MRFSRMCIKTVHSKKQDEWPFMDYLFRSGQLKRHAAGIYAMGNILVRVREKVLEVIRKNLDYYDCAEVSLPVLQPKKIWDMSGRWEVYSSGGLMYTFDGKNGRYCLAPTGEEIVLDFAKDNIVSYKDLPVHIFQIGCKYRDEIRVRGGILRSKEFLMKDGYSFHATFEGMVAEYEKMRECYFKIFKSLGLDTVAVKALNSTIGGKVSEEFMCFTDIGDDVVYIAEDGFALNEEVVHDADLLENLKQSFNFNVDALEKKLSLELGHIFQLGITYSSKMDGLFVDKDGEKKPYYMGCYGIGVDRVLGAVCDRYCDDKGLLWPKGLAPYNFAIIYATENESSALKVYENLKSSDIDVVLFDVDASFGSKIKDAQLLGFTYVLIFGKKYETDGLVEVEKRFDGSKMYIRESEIVNLLER